MARQAKGRQQQTPRTQPQRVNPADAERTAALPADREGPARSDPSGKGGVRSRSSSGSAGYGGQPGMGGYEQGFQRGPSSNDARTDRIPAGRPSSVGARRRPPKDGLGAITSSTDAGEGKAVGAGRIVKDPGSVGPVKP